MNPQNPETQSGTNTVANAGAGNAAPARPDDGAHPHPPTYPQVYPDASRGAQGGEKTPARQWAEHPVDLRFSLPFFGRRFYFTMVAGGEKRAPERIALESAQRGGTVGNVLFGLGISGAVFVLVLVTVALQSAIIEF